MRTTGRRPLLRAATGASCGLALLVGCQTGPPGPIFPAVSPPIVWPKPPDRARIRYIGELRGEASLGARATGWDAVREFLGGPEPKVEFIRPSAIAVAPGGERVYVADEGIGAVHLLNLAERQYKLLRGSEQDPLRVPLDLCLANGQLLVVDRGRATVDVFDLAGNWRCTRRWPEIKAPVAIAYDPAGNIFWVADVELHACIGVTPDLQTLVRRIGQRGVAPGQFNYPNALACPRPRFSKPIAPATNPAAAPAAIAPPDSPEDAAALVVADAMNFRIQVFDEAGRPVCVFGEKGDAAGTFSRPRGLALDADGHIYVVDNQFENVQVFDPAGRLLMALGQEGQAPGEFSMPAGIAIDQQNRIWIADSLNRRVQVFQYLPERADGE